MYLEMNMNFSTLSDLLILHIIADGHRENRSTATGTYLSDSFRYLIGPKTLIELIRLVSLAHTRFLIHSGGIMVVICYVQLCTLGTPRQPMPGSWGLKGTIRPSPRQTYWLSNDRSCGCG